MYRVGDKVCSILNAAKVGVIHETGLCNHQGIQWVHVKFEKGQRWMLADALLEYSDIHSIPVPHGVVVVSNHHHYPEVFQQPDSKATVTEVQSFADTVYRMWLSKKAA